jgi:hypothetical protein
MAKQQVSAADLACQVQDLLPARVGFSTADLAHCRRGQTLPRLPYRRAISFALGVDATDLMQPGGREPSRDFVTASSTVADVERALPVPALVPRAADPLVTRDLRHGRQTTSGPVSLEDFGAEVRLRFDQHLPWPKALRILQDLKTRTRFGGAEAIPLGHLG